MLVTLGWRPAQADEVLADHTRRDRRQLHPLPLGPGQEHLDRPQIGPLRVRVVVLGVEIFLPGEACRPPCPLDQPRQARLAAGRWHVHR